MNSVGHVERLRLVKNAIAPVPVEVNLARDEVTSRG